MGYCCPRCNGQNVQSFAVAHANGFSTVNTQTRAGLAFHATTQGIQQNVVSQMTAPPLKMEFIPTQGLLRKVGVLLGCYIGVSVVVSQVLGANGPVPQTVTLASLAGLLVWRFRAVSQHNMQEWPLLYERWQKSWVCLQCGEGFLVGV
ncbi:hypothetical protein [Anthocerotibacter panamensis]|uniref:hypothetical protein n=1 Tax=Anthocerotibacter panamensis TaxID=2857077 RepID=UPI001C404F8F|nr:hypothetical protein [Anthocerotibacter panamensis]